MSAHFSSFTSDAMHAIGQELAAERRERRDFIATNRTYTQDLLATAQRERAEAEAERRQRAAQEADARRLFMSELRSEVHALRNRFELARRDMAADFQHMAGELRAAREAFRHRPGNQGARRRASRPAAYDARPTEPAPPAPQAPPEEPPANAMSSTPGAPALTAEPRPEPRASQPAKKRRPEPRPRPTPKAKPENPRKRRG